MQHIDDVNSISLPPYELLAQEKAIRYQQWIMATIAPYLGNRILEIGAGTGNMSRWLTAAEYLLLTEPDPQLLAILAQRMQKTLPDPSKISINRFDLEKQDLSMFAEENIDTIVSFNVFEHLQNDVLGLKRCAGLLRQNQAAGIKRIITFVPAHHWAYGSRDKKTGHYRRYNRKTFTALHEQVAPDAKLILIPFNFVGLWSWLVNGRILKRPTMADSMVSVSEVFNPTIKLIDKILLQGLHIPLGQSLLAIQEF